MSHALAGCHVQPRLLGVAMDADDQPTLWQTALGLAGIGMTNAVAVLLGMGLGWLLDNRFGTSPVLVIVGLVVGIAAGVVITRSDIRAYLDGKGAR